MPAVDTAANLAPLWERLRASFARAAAITGGAARIALTLAPALRHEIHAWIALIEHLVRKLLFAEAGRLAPSLGWAPRTPSSALRSSRAASPSVARRPRSAEENPETWSVRFALSPPRDPRAVPEAQAPRIRALWGPSMPPPTPAPSSQRVCCERHKPLHLARRFEALRRVLRDPGPHARRLALLMRRLVSRYPEAPMRFTSRSARVSHFDREDPRLGVDCCVAAFSALPAFNSS